MRNQRLGPFWHRAGPFGAIVALAVAGETSQGCGGGNMGTGTGGGHMGGSTTTSMSNSSSNSSTSTTTTTTSSGTTTTTNMCSTGPFQGVIAPGANGGFTDAFDAAPNSTGTTVFFTAIDPMGNAGVFKQDICPVGTVAAVYTGGAFELPHNIAVSSDDKTLFVADTSAQEDPTDPTKDAGVLFSLSAAGGTAPSVLVGSVSPRGVHVHQENGSDVVYFTGTDKTNGMPGVFKVAAAGGTVTTVAEGPPFVDPGGVTVASDGTVYVLDTAGAGPQIGTIIVVKAGTAMPPQLAFQVGYPAGIALLMDGSKLLVSGLDPSAESDALVEVDTATMMVTNNTMGIGGYAEAAGLHRASTVDVFAWADTKATPMGMTGTGTVFVIK